MNAMTLIVERLTTLLDGVEGFPATVLFDCGDEGAVLIDGVSGKIVVTTERAPADCQITMSAAIFQRILNGELDETSAFMQGEMRIAGEIGLATRVSDLIRARAQSAQHT